MTAIVSVYGRITAVQQQAGRTDRVLLKNPDGAFMVQANACPALAANRLAPGDYVLVGGQLRSTVDNSSRSLTWIEPFYISYQAADLTGHLDTVLNMLLTAGQQNNACAACPQNCTRSQGLGDVP